MDLDADSSEVAQIELPRYKCHKEVWALKIKEIKNSNRLDGSVVITPVEERYAPFRVDFEYVQKHKPEVGGYFVVYKDGYKSYSPAQAFEEDYSLIN